VTTATSSARILWLALGTLLALIFTVCAGISLAGHTVGAVTRNQHYVVHNEVSEVTVDGVNAEVTLVPAPGNEVVVDTHAKGTLWVPKLKTDIDGGHLTLRGSCHDMVLGSCESSFTIRVPAGLPVSVSTRSGDVRASDLSGPLSIHAGSGDVALSGLSGGTEAKVSSGDIEASRLSGRLRLQTSSGDIDAAELSGRTIDAHANSGDVFLDVATVPKRVNVAASSGDVVISVPRNGSDGYAATTATSSGDSRLLVDINDASEHSVSAVTSSGDATIRYR
jgi:putative adhesin